VRRDRLRVRGAGRRERVLRMTATDLALDGLTRRLDIIGVPLANL
jgi:hypothetical protein